MSDLKISQMLDMQNRLYELHRHEWRPRTALTANYQLLWSVDELGEVIAIIKKKESLAVMENEAVRAHFVEEMDDVFMYLFDALQCFGVDEHEFTRAYLEKLELSGLTSSRSASFLSSKWTHGDKDVKELSLGEMLELRKKQRESLGLSNEPDHADSPFRLFSVVEALGAAGGFLRSRGGAEAVCKNINDRADFLEIIVDVFLAMFDVALSLGITAQELSYQYQKKFDYNMNRDWHKQNDNLYEDK
ncbi:MAG: hypothetical protein IJB92_00745 [Clostridia bacterium]|nr:hypothetical protein [Clostridia bacterium]